MSDVQYEIEKEQCLNSVEDTTNEKQLNDNQNEKSNVEKEKEKDEEIAKIEGSVVHLHQIHENKENENEKLKEITEKISVKDKTEKLPKKESSSV